MRGILGMSRNRRINYFTPLTPTILVTETNVFFITIMKPWAGNIVDLDEEVLETATTSIPSEEAI